MEIQIATELLDYLREFEDRYKLKHNGHIESVSHCRPIKIYNSITGPYVTLWNGTKNKRYYMRHLNPKTHLMIR